MINANDLEYKIIKVLKQHEWLSASAISSKIDASAGKVRMALRFMDFVEVNKDDKRCNIYRLCGNVPLDEMGVSILNCLKSLKVADAKTISGITGYPSWLVGRILPVLMFDNPITRNDERGRDYTYRYGC